ncbi:GMC oxidoreductase [Asticcacaulis sp.]|uniref:GMC oxidoreductase n=1 Tax=Asticcacaulis sp. TaxID=1872648 RepID=UPI003F7BEBA4
MSDYEFDAIVIGSGVSGGWAAKELTEKGMKVLMLDRGRMVEHSADYTYEGTGPWEQPYRGQTPPALLEDDYYAARYGGAGQTAVKGFMNNDRLNPYAIKDGPEFRWVRPGIVGGKSITWGRVSLRFGPQDFEANGRDGHGNDWPIRYDDIAPWYSYVEKYAGIAGSKEGLPHLPDGEFQPPHPMNVAETWLKDRLEKAMPDRKVISIRTANMTEDKPEQGRSRCQSRSQCNRGCSFGAYFSTQAVTLPAARATNRLTLLSDQVVTSLEYDPKTKRVTGVRTIDANTQAAHTYRSRIVFLCASAMASNQILLNSKLPGSDRSFADSSGKLGRYIMDHPMLTLFSGNLPEGTHADVIEYGRKPAGIYIPRFRNLDGQDADADFLRGYGCQGGGSRGVSSAVGFGASMKAGLRKYGLWSVGFNVFGECLPYLDNTITLHPTKVDRFGVPQALFNVTYRDNEKKMMADGVRQGRAMMEAAGLINISAEEKPHIPGDSIHEMGGACMGKDPRTSVTNAWNQLHDAPNVFVTDGAAMASTSCVNPSLTFMAFTARAADHAVKQVKAGVI